MHFESRTGETATIRLWSLSEDALVEVDQAGDSLVVVTKWGEFDIGHADAVVRESLRRMRLGPVFLQNVTTASGVDSTHRGEPADGDSAGQVDLDRVLERLSGSVVHSLGLRDGQAPLLSVVPVVSFPDFALRTIPDARLVRLSHFSTMRPDAGGMVLESPNAQFEVALSQAAAVQVAAALAVPRKLSEIASYADVAEPVAADIAAFLVAAGVALLGDEHGRFAEDEDGALRGWSHHELQFHARSRARPGDAPSEAVFGQAEDTPPPVVKPVPAGPRIPLAKPRAGASRGDDVTLAELLETDHVCPEFSDRELTLEQLGEFLFRSARVRSVGPAHLRLGQTHEATQRPYFSIACFYELELYVSLNRCAGLRKGVYHYDPQGHALTLINDDGAELGELLDMAKVAAGSRRRPSALITVTARMERLSWALGGAAYSTALMHLGALQQTLYLTAKAIGMSAHAVPIDASDAVDRALGIQWPAEISVGECVLDRL